jgi:hypothetical protein
MPTIWDGPVLEACRATEKGVRNAILHHTSIQNRCDGHRLVCRQELPGGPPIVSARYGSITQTMPVPFAKNCAACARGTPEGPFGRVADHRTTGPRLMRSALISYRRARSSNSCVYGSRHWRRCRVANAPACGSGCRRWLTTSPGRRRCLAMWACVHLSSRTVWRKTVAEA